MLKSDQLHRIHASQVILHPVQEDVMLETSTEKIFFQKFTAPL